jgi:hypothetical protein
MKKTLVALILSMFALGIAGCGDDEGDVGTVPTVPLSVPGDTTTTPDEFTDTTTIETVPDVAPTPTPTPTPTPPEDGLPEDSPENDTPPDSPETQQFEQFCNDNPGAC